MERTPFPNAGPLEADEVQGRDVEAGDLVRLLGGRQPVALIAPRRYGKTSLLRRAVWLLDQVEPTTTVWLDLYGLSSASDFAVRLGAALQSSTGAFREVVDRIAGSLSLHLGVVTAELRRPGPDGPDPIGTIHTLLETLVEAATRHPTVIVIDEVADAVGVDNVLEITRTHLQPAYREVGFAFAGSRPTMMSRLFGDTDQPFYSQAQRMDLGPLDLAHVVEVVHAGFRSTGRTAGMAADAVATQGAGHPQRSMELADAVWWRTEPGEEATAEIWERALERVRSRASTAMRDFFSVLPSSQRAVLRAVARTGAPFAAAEGRFHDLSTSSITSARNALVDAGHIVAVDRETRIVDPLLSDWILRTLP